MEVVYIDASECPRKVMGSFSSATSQVLWIYLGAIFLVTPAARFEGTLFIDGLDEKRAGRGDRDTVDALSGC